MPNPLRVNVEAIRISAAEEMTSQRLGRKPHRCRRLDLQMHRELADGQSGAAEGQQADTHDGAGHRQNADDG